jgi:hypothetical protein
MMFIIKDDRHVYVQVILSNSMHFVPLHDVYKDAKHVYIYARLQVMSDTVYAFCALIAYIIPLNLSHWFGIMQGRYRFFCGGAIINDISKCHR